MSEVACLNIMDYDEACLLDRFIEFTLLSTCDKNIGTFLYEPMRRSKDYTTVSTRDDRNFAIKSRVHARQVSRFSREHVALPDSSDRRES